MAMNEMEFFAKFEIKPDVTLVGKAVVIWRRGSGMYATLRQLSENEFYAEVIGERGGWQRVGTRRTFHGALKLLREHPDLINA